MIQDVDRSLEALLELELGNPLPFNLSFEVPDDTFGPVSNTRPTLDCYLYDIREHRELRSREVRLRRSGFGTILAEPPPATIQVSYCITAWSPVQAGAGVSPVSDEHQLLGRVVRCLLRHPVLPASTLAGTLAGTEPPPSTQVIIPDPLKRPTEFWSAVKGKLRPSLDYAVTFAMPTDVAFDGPMISGITTQIAAGTSPPDRVYATGLIVQTNDAVRRPIADAWVRVVETGRVYTTGATGGVVMDRVPEGTYTLVARAIGYKEGTAQMHVPTTAGPVLIQLDLL